MKALSLIFFTLTITILFIFGLLCGCGISERGKASDATCFFNHFPEEQGKVMKGGVAEFNLFLKTNYPNEVGTIEKTSAYFKDLEKHSFFNPNWKFNKESNKALLKAYEASGLRKSIYIRGEETEGFEEILEEDFSEGMIRLHGVTDSEQAEKDSLTIAENRQALGFNENSLFKEAVIACSNYWPVLESYYKTRTTSLNLDIGVIIHGLENEFDPSEYENPIYQSIVFVELFSWQMSEDLKRDE